MFNKLIKTLKNNRGNSLAEFAVTTAMMATLATTAAPKFGNVGAGAKEKKTMNNSCFSRRSWKISRTI